MMQMHELVFPDFGAIAPNIPNLGAVRQMQDAAAGARAAVEIARLDKMAAFAGTPRQDHLYARDAGLGDISRLPGAR